MPKLIYNVRGRAIAEARKILTCDGYAALTIRRIAQNLEIGVGTIYNYFPSKEFLAANVMLEDWQELTRDFEELYAGQPAEKVAAELFALVRIFPGVMILPGVSMNSTAAAVRWSISIMACLPNSSPVTSGMHCLKNSGNGNHISRSFSRNS